MGTAAMPGARSNKAPRFKGEGGELFSHFLREFEALATIHGLSNAERVETLLWYAAPHLADFWRSLDGYDTCDWPAFRATLQQLYRNTKATTCYTKQGLINFVDGHAQTRIRDEEDVVSYYREFLERSMPLYNSRQLSDEERNDEFCQGFHPEDREILTNRLFAKNPNHPSDKAYDIKDVLEAAQTYFSNI
jgi:hypothetical protein